MMRSSLAPQVSVIIPTYNRAHFLRETVASVAAQTLTPFEILIVDDGSTDSTDAVVHELKQLNFPFQIHYFWKENAGPSAARNLGLSNVKGEYVAFLDADDLWDPLKLEWQLALIEGSDKAVCCNYSSINANGEVVDDGVYRKLHWLPSQKERVRQALEGNFCYGSASGVVLSKAAIGTTRFDETLRLAEDWDFWIQLMQKGIEFILVERPLAAIRSHTTNLQNSAAALAYYDFRVFLKWQVQISASKRILAIWQERLACFYLASQRGEPWANSAFTRLNDAERLALARALKGYFTAGVFLKRLFTHTIQVAKAFFKNFLFELLGLRCGRRFVSSAFKG